MRRDADTALRHIDTLRERGTALPAAVYEVWVAALAIFERNDETNSVYQAWLNAHPDDGRAKTGQLRRLQSRFEQLATAASSSPLEMANLLSQISEMDPPPGWLYRQVDRLYLLRDEAIIPTLIPERTLARLCQDSDTPPSLLEAIGVNAAEAGEMTRALACFQQITERAPDDAAAWNNFAWVLGRGDAARLEEALAAVNKAIELEPDDYRFRETRGQILVKLRRWQSAIEDLEFAINGMPESADIHASLATAYDAVGEARLAAMHRRQVGL